MDGNSFILALPSHMSNLVYEQPYFGVELLSFEFLCRFAEFLPVFEGSIFVDFESLVLLFNWPQTGP